MRRLTIIEPHLSGHHAAYLRRIIEGARLRGIETRVIHSDPVEDHPEIRPFLFTGDASFIRLPLSGRRRLAGPIGSRLQQFYYWNYLSKMGSSIEPARDLILLPYADYALYAVALKGSPFRGAPWAAICMRPSFHQRAAGVRGAPSGPSAWLQRWLYHRVAKQPSLCRLFFIDETFFRSPLVRSMLAAKSSLLPEPADEVAVDARYEEEPSGFAAGDFVVLMYGAISERKGLSKLLTAIACPGVPANVKVLISGRQDPAAKSIIQRALESDRALRSRVVCNDHYHTPLQESACFRRADVVWLNYERHLGMSGVLVQAARHGKAIVACEDGVMGWHTAQKRLGIVLPARASSEQIANNLCRMLEDEPGRARMGANGKTAFSAHSTSEFQRTLFTPLEPFLE